MNLLWKLDEGAVEPYRAHPEEDAGFDLVSRFDHVIDTSLTTVHTGVRVAVPQGYYSRVVARSSAATRGIVVYEGIIDCGYRGELLIRAQAIHVPVHLPAGSAIAQLIVSSLPRVNATVVQELPPSERGDRGFGSTGQ